MLNNYMYLKTTASNGIHDGSIVDDLIRDVQLVRSQHEVCVSSSPNKNYFLQSYFIIKNITLFQQQKAILGCGDSKT